MQAWKTLIIVFCLLCVCGACATAPTAKTLTPVTVQLLWTHTAQFAGLYTADQLGYYRDEGLAVTFLEGGADINHLLPVKEGKAQFGVAGADELIVQRANGETYRAIATIYRRSPTVFISLAEKDITRPQDFAGKTIRVPVNLRPTLQAMLAKVGVKPGQYQMQTTPSDLAMFASGEIPVWGVYINSFAISVKNAGYDINIVYPDDYGVHFYADCLYTSDDLLKKDPDLARRFLRASLKGWTYAIENPEQIAAFVEKYNPQADRALELQRLNASIPLVNTGEDHIGWMRAEVWDTMEKTLLDQGVLSKAIPISDVYTLGLLQDIYP